MINKIKINNVIYYDFKEKNIDENGVEVWNITQDLEEFKTIAIDTMKWQIGDNVKKAIGNTQTNISASNAKAIALLAKLIEPEQKKIDSLTDLEKDSWTKLKGLADGGYADSKLLNASLSNVNKFIASGTDKVARITSATDIDEIIEMLNED